MSTNRDRQRAAARARLEREMELRAEAAQRRRRRTQTILAASATFVVVIAVVAVVIAVGSGDSKKSTKAGASTAPCAFKPVTMPSASPGTSPQPLPTELKDVGMPSQDRVVRTGVQLMTINTNLGPIQVQLDTAKVPCTAASFTYLAEKKFFDNTKCHRMTTSGIFVLQCGDPSGTGMGGPRYNVPDENLPTTAKPAYPEGVLAMANTGQPNTGGSQFFIVFQDSEQLPAQYSVLGHVLQGLDVVKRVAAAGVTPAEGGQEGDGAPKIPVNISSITVSPPAAALPAIPPASPVAAVSSTPAASAPGSSAPGSAKPSSSK